MRQLEAKTQFITCRSSIDAMESPSDASPQRLAEEMRMNLTISPPEASDLSREQQHPPSTAGSLDSYSKELSRSSQSHPVAPPAWDSKVNVFGTRSSLALDAEATGGYSAVVSHNRAALSASAGSPRPNTSTEEHKTRFSGANLQLDLIPPPRPPQSRASALVDVLEQVPGPGPSPADLSSPEITSRFGGRSKLTQTRVFFAQEDDVQQNFPEPDSWLTQQTREDPPSTRSPISEIFVMEMGSPLPSPVPAPAPLAAPARASTPRASSYDREVSEESSLVSRHFAALVPSRDDSAVRSVSRAVGLWGRRTPSPTSSTSPQQRQDPWGRLQQSLDPSARQHDSKSFFASIPRVPPGLSPAPTTSSGEAKRFSSFLTRTSDPPFRPLSGHPPPSRLPTAPASSSRRPIRSVSSLSAGESLPIRPPSAPIDVPRRGVLRADSAEARESRIGGGRGADDHELQQRRWRGRASEITSGARGYVEGGFMRAAEAIRDSPRLRQAASTAASVMSSAATTARARFEITSRTIGNMLAASAQSFEDFVGEHLQGDAGWEQVVMTDGCNNLLVPRSKVLTQTFLVGPRCCLCWEFRVKDHNIGFALRRRVQCMGGSTEEDIFQLKRYRSGETFQGRWINQEDEVMAIVMVWNNSHSCLRSKTLSYNAKVLRSGVDSTHPPPLPSGTPGTQSDAPPQGSHEQTQRRKILGGKGTADSLNTEGGVGNAVTEGFAIEESEAEGSHHPGISREEIAIFAELENKKVGEKQDR